MINKKYIFKVEQVYPQSVWSTREIKNILRITHEHDDALIDNLINTAINTAESFTSLSLKTYDVKLIINDFDEQCGIKLKYFPVLEVINAEFKYFIDDAPRMLYPDEEQDMRKPVSLKYKAGYSKDSIPYEIKQGILSHVSHMYDKQEELGGSFSQSIRSYYMPYKFLNI